MDQTRQQRRRVLFVAPLPPPFGGVAQISQSLLRSALAEEFLFRPLNLSKQEGREREQTFRVDRRSYTFSLLVWLRLIKELLSFRPAVVYLASSYDYSYLRNLLLMLTARLGGCRVVCHFHGRRDGPLFRAPGPLQRALLRAGSLSFHKIILLSAGLREELAPFWKPEKTEIVPNFVNPHDFCPAKFAAIVPRLIFVGRLSDDKGIFELIEAVARLHAKGRPLLVDLLGVGETEEAERRVREAVAQSGLTALFVFHGVRTGGEKAALLAGADVFVLPSKLEIFPLTILEAYASGLPVISTRVGAIPEIVREGENGFLVAPSDVEALAERLESLLDDVDLRRRMGAANRRAAETLYAETVAVARLAAILRAV